MERTYNVPLRKGFINKAKYKKTKKAVSTLKEFLSKHMKSDKILIGKHLNQHLWKHGIKNPPHHVKVTVTKDDNGTVKAELLGFKYDHLTKEEMEKEEKKKPKAEASKKEQEKPIEKEEKLAKKEHQPAEKKSPQEEEKASEAPAVSKQAVSPESKPAKKTAPKKKTAE